jgi:hypothetical protein
MAAESDWSRVDDYAKKRRDERGDVYGWLRDEQTDAAIILAGESSEEESFPKEISGIHVVVKKISTPEKQS